MKRILLLSLYFTACAQIVELKNIEEILAYIRPDTLCLLDIDNTILEPDNVEQIGSEQWFYSTLQAMQETMCYEEAKHKLIIQYATFMLSMPCKLVEELNRTTTRVVNHISSRCTTLGFTARALILAPSTNNWLQYYDIHFNAPVQNQGFMIGDNPVLLYEKVIYCHGHKNADTLFTVLARFGMHPTHIVFIDDKEHYLTMIETECARRGIEFTGLRYSYLDEKVAAYLKQAFLKQDEIE